MASQNFAPVLTALSVMQSGSGASEKKNAHKYLDDFQKSVRTGKHYCRMTSDSVLARCMDYNRSFAGRDRACRSKAVCRDHTEGQSETC